MYFLERFIFMKFSYIFKTFFLNIGGGKACVKILIYYFFSLSISSAFEKKK